MRSLLAAAVLCLFAPAAHAVPFNMEGSCVANCPAFRNVVNGARSLLHLDLSFGGWKPGGSFGDEAITAYTLFASRQPVGTFFFKPNTPFTATRGRWGGVENTIAELSFAYSAGTSATNQGLTILGTILAAGGNAANALPGQMTFLVSQLGFVDTALGTQGITNPTTFAFDTPAGLLAPVPLPAALPLLMGGMGLLGALGFRSRRSRSRAAGPQSIEPGMSPPAPASA